MKIGIDIISDLNLEADDEFDWEGKATSLYLIIAGNISNDLKIIEKTLRHLKNFYQCIFYASGSLEHDSVHFVRFRNKELGKICNTINNVTYLYKSVAIINGVAILGCNGWYGNRSNGDSLLEQVHVQAFNVEDIQYLKLSIEKLQLHLDVRKIILVSHSTPSKELFFSEIPNNTIGLIPLNFALVADTERKVSHWIYGSYHKLVDTTIQNINYVNNSKYDTYTYWPKRIEIEI